MMVSNTLRVRRNSKNLNVSPVDDCSVVRDSQAPSATFCRLSNHLKETGAAPFMYAIETLLNRQR